MNKEDLVYANKRLNQLSDATVLSNVAGCKEAESQRQVI